jgi:acetolactate synthase-1/2/3 large subunit
MNIPEAAKQNLQKQVEVNIDWDNADLIVEYLRLLEVEFVFGVPGGAIEPFFNALARSQKNGGPKVVVARHEAGAAFMAEGYARETGKLGVCCATTGPGATNLLTGIASAYADNVAVLVITAQTPLPKFGRNALQDSSCTAVDTVTIFKQCTRYSTLISHTEQINTKLIAAIMAANRTPNGPAHISIPSDILRQKPTSGSDVQVARLVQQITLTDNSAVDKLTEMLSNSWRVALFLGKGCGAAIEEIMIFSDLTHAPIVAGPAGKRWINGYHRRFRGVYGFAGHQSAIQTMQDNDIDLFIAVGTPITEIDTAGWHSQLLNNRLVHIDSTIEHFSRTPMAKHHVCGDLNLIFQQLNENIKQGLKWGRSWGSVDPIQQKFEKTQLDSAIHGYQITLDDPQSCVSDAIPLKPQRVVTEFARHIPLNYRLHLDAGNTWAWFTHYHHRKCDKGYYHIAMGFGSMGWAIGAAIGSSLGSQQPSVCITGDGSYLMSGQEITVALQRKIAVIYVILNDSELGMVKHGQQLGGAEEVGFELPMIDYAKIAQAMNIEGITVNTPAELVAIDWQRLGQKDGPTLIDVRIDANEVPPMGQRVKGLSDDNPSATPGGG